MNKKTIIKAAYESSLNYKPVENQLIAKQNYEYGFMKWAEWVAQKIYSEEDLRNAMIKFHRSNTDDLIKRCDEIISQMKN